MASTALSSTRGSITWASNSCESHRDLPGRTDSRKDGWAPYVASCSITSSCLESAICCAWSASTSPITTRTDLTCRSIATRPSRAPSNRRVVARSSRFRASAASTTAIRGRRERVASVFRHHSRRIASELAKLGYAVDKDTVAKYMPKPARRPRRPPSQTWKTFLRNHLAGTIAIDFLTVPTVTFNVLYVFFVLSLERRRVLHVNVTAHPRATWTAQQIVEALDADAVPARLIRDRDGIYGAEFDARVDHLGIEQLRIAPRSPWQNGFAERWVGTLRRELLDHVIVLGERHLLRLVREYVAYYNEDRP